MAITTSGMLDTTRASTPHAVMHQQPSRPNPMAKRYKRPPGQHWPTHADMTWISINHPLTPHAAAAYSSSRTTRAPGHRQSKLLLQ
jgi:hypothetical protein